jgi:NitT/TauT family transport system ATP-binding protein
MHEMTLPNYRDLPTDVAQRMAKVEAREVAMEVVNLKKIFGEKENTTEVLHDISFQVKRREFLCVLGASGCGKSTLLRILGGLETCRG